MKKLIPYIKPYLKLFIFAVLLTVGYAGFMGAAPLIEGLITTRLKDDVVDIANKVPGAAHHLLTDAIQNTMRDLRNDVQKKIAKLPVSYYDKRTVGDILSIISNDIDTISNALQQSLSKILTAFLSIALAVVLMFYINPVMAIIAPK